MTLKTWRELPVRVRRSRRELYEYIKGEVSGEDTDLDSRLDYIELLLSVDVSFTVKDDQGTPVAVQGATVTLNGKTGTTGAAGGCTIKTILPNTYTVTVSKTGFKPYSDDIVIDSTHTSFNITLETAAS